MDMQEIGPIGKHGIDSQPLQVRNMCDSRRRQEQTIAVHDFTIFLIDTIHHFGHLIELVPCLPLELCTGERSDGQQEDHNPPATCYIHAD